MIDNFFKKNNSLNNLKYSYNFLFIILWFIIISKELFIYDAEKIIILAILFILIILITNYKEIINEYLDKEYYNMIFIWYKFYVKKVAIIRDFWRLYFAYIDQKDINKKEISLYNKNLIIFFLKIKYKYIYFLFFFLKFKLLMSLIDFINIKYITLFNSIINLNIKLNKYFKWNWNILYIL